MDGTDQPHLTDLEFGSLLGEGAFARVLHARDVQSGKEYAVKIVEKRQVQVQGRRTSVLAEKAMLSSLDHPGIVRLHSALQDDWSLYFVLELITGGELATQIARMGRCPPDFARYYTAELVCILAYLRARRVAHRDLKPENLLLNTEGHLKLVDFDAAVVVPDEGEGDAAAGCYQGQPTFAGTSLYLPPEVLLNTAKPQAAFALDLWALGCILFQMLVGETPFHATSEYLAFQRILRGNYTFPQGFRHEGARELVASLLAAEPSARPGQGPEGLAELQRHAFFGGSQASFRELRRQPPPPRAESLPSHRCFGRAGSGRSSRSDCSNAGRSASLHSSLHSFDFASSAECTPEVGQGFRTRKCVQIIPVADHASGSPTAAPPGSEAPPHVAMPVESASPPCVPSGSPRTELQGQMQWKDPLTTPGPSAQAGIAAWMGHGLPGCSQPAVATTGRMVWWAVADVPGPSWHWLRELVQRQTLLCGEQITLCGSVVRRRLPCLRPKVLMLTDLPRLLVLDASGLRLLHDVHLGSFAEGCTTKGGPNTASIAVKSSVDFVLSVAGKRFWCCDVNLGAQTWATKLSNVQGVLQRPAGEARSALTAQCQ